MQYIVLYGLIFNMEECKILRPMVIANPPFATINTISAFTFSSKKLPGKYSRGGGGMIFLTINKGGQGKHTGIKGGIASLELSIPP